MPRKGYRMPRLVSAKASAKLKYKAPPPEPELRSLLNQMRAMLPDERREAYLERDINWTDVVWKQSRASGHALTTLLYCARLARRDGLAIVSRQGLAKAIRLKGESPRTSIHLAFTRLKDLKEIDYPARRRGLVPVQILLDPFASLNVEPNMFEPRSWDGKMLIKSPEETAENRGRAWRMLKFLETQTLNNSINNKDRL